jgi:uncharacterized membrane protein
MSHGAADETLVDRLTGPAVALDLLAVVAYAAVAVIALTRPSVYGTPLAVALGLPLLFFAPGYGLVSALFPGATPGDAVETRETEARGTGEDGSERLSLAEARQRGVSGAERVALGFGVSLALLPVVGLALELSPWPIDPTTVLLSVASATVGFAAVGAARRFRRPPDARFSVPVRAWFDDARGVLFGGSLFDRALTVGLAAAVVAAVAAMGYAVAVPGPDQSYTGVSLLSQNETGELVADDYPRNFEAGSSRPLVVELDNREGERTGYSVVVELQRVEQADDGGAEVLEERRLATFTPTVGAGETWRTVHEVTPTMTGEDLRLVYLVYRGEPPNEPTTGNAYRHVHVWVNVTA